MTLASLSNDLRYVLVVLYCVVVPLVYAARVINNRRHGRPPLHSIIPSRTSPALALWFLGCLVIFAVGLILIIRYTPAS